MTENVRKSRSRSRTRFVVAGALLVTVLGLAYVRIGWWQMESACSAEAPGRDTSSVDFGWSWVPPGFSCSFGNGDIETSLWF